MNYVDDRPRVPCKWCSKPTPMTGTKLCDNCYELDVRIRLDTALARRILTHYERAERNMRWKGDGVDTHKGEYWYKCQVCGGKDWISFNGTLDQLTCSCSCVHYSKET